MDAPSRVHAGMARAQALSALFLFAVAATLLAVLSPAWAQGAAAPSARAAGPLPDRVLERVLAQRLLRVCIWPDYFGISYRHPRTGTLLGIDIELSRALSRDLDVRLEYVDTDFNRVLDDLEAGRCDIAMMAVGVTPPRAARVAFSLPYLRSDVYAVTTRSNTRIRDWADIDRAGHVVVVQKGTFMEPLMQETLRQARLVAATRPGEREREVESGRADVFITDYPYSQRMLLNTDWARVVEPNRPIRLTDYAYAVPKGDAAWLTRVNQFVEQIRRDGRLEAAARPFNLGPIVVRE